MSNVAISLFDLQSDGLHFALTAAGPIARIDVDMLGPKAIRTMVGIAVAFYFSAAILAAEIFNFSLEFFHFK